MSKFKLNYKLNTTDDGWQLREFSTFDVDAILGFINKNRAQEISFANNSLSPKQLSELLRNLALCVEGKHSKHKNIRKNIIRINLENVNLRSDNANDVAGIIVAGAPNLKELNLDKNPNFYTKQAFFEIGIVTAVAEDMLKKKGGDASLITKVSLGKDFINFCKVDKENERNAASEASSSSEKEKLKGKGKEKEKTASANASSASSSKSSPRTPELAGIQNRQDLDYEIAAKIPGHKGRLLLTYVDTKDNAVLYSGELARKHPNTIFAFGDNVGMWKKRNKAVAEGKDLSKIQHDGSGQAYILGGKKGKAGRLRKNVIGIPTCDEMDEAKLKAYITETIHQIKILIDEGYDVVIPTLKDGKINMANDRALNRQPKNFKGEVVANFIASEITRIIGVQVPLHDTTMKKEKVVHKSSKFKPKTKPSSSKRPIIREEDETVGEIRSESVTESLEAEYAVSSSSSSREEAVSSSAAESLAPITYTVYCSVTEPDSKTHINAAKTRKIVSDDLTYIFSEIEKGKYDQVSFRGNDLSKLNFKANDKRFRDRVKKDVSSNGELLTYLIAENETVKRFDFGGTGVTGKFCASLESNIKRKSSEKPLSKFVLKRIEFGEDDATGGPKLLNGERGAINDARKAREEFAGQLDLIKQLAKDIEKEKNIYSIEQSLEGISSVALNTPMKIGKYENITLLHYLAYESGTNVFRNSRHLYMKEVAEKLLNAGISPIVKDGQGRTAHELAVNIGNQRHFLVGYIYQNMDLIDYLFAPTQKAFESPFYCDSIDLIRNGRVNDIDWTFEDLKEKDRTMKGTKKKDCEGYFKKVLNQAIDDVPVRNTSSKYYVNGIGLVKNTAIPEPVQKTSLLEYAIRPESYPDSARFHANSAKIAERLIKNAGYSGKTSNGSTLLYALSQTEQDADLIKILIEKDPFPGSTLQEKNKNGKGPLQLAAERKGNSEVLKVLLETGKCTDDDKQAALANAVDSKYASVLNTYTAAGNNKRSVIQKRDTFAKMVTESKTGLSHSKE